MKRYGNLDGIRTIAALGVVLMHVRANIGFKISGGGTEYLINRLVPQLSSFVYLFFIISGFAMCCGYYQSIKNNEITLDKFYSKRYVKILPFFTLLVFMDLAVKVALGGRMSLGDMYEAFADLTLMFGFLPTSDITVVGVGWTLGVIFGFYILFPFFVYMLWNRKRAWFTFALSIGLNFLCRTYFLSEGNAIRCNVIRYLCYFIAGGLIYLYKAEIERLVNKSWKGLLLCLFGFICVFCFSVSGSGFGSLFVSEIKLIIGFTVVVCGALCPNTVVLINRFSKLISKYSLEVYLSHMMVFRVLEKIKVTRLFGTNINSLLFTYVMTVIGAVGFAAVFNICLNYSKFANAKKKVK